MTSKLFTKGISPFLNSAHQSGLINVGVSFYVATTKNPAHLSLQPPIQGIYKRPHNIIPSSLKSGNQSINCQESVATDLNCVMSVPLDHSVESHSLAGGTMDGEVGSGNPLLQSDINGNAVFLVHTEYIDQPQAELCASGANCVTPKELGSVAALADWLKDRLPTHSSPTEQWGVLPGTKRVANLWLELLQGEISLEDSRPPKRTVHVASVKIKDELGRLLVEAHQEMDDGSIRERNRPLSEKMKPGENVEDACLRGIYEELGAQLGARERIIVLKDSYKREVQERESFSYPGLMTCYILHSMEATIKYLPETDFITEEDEVSNHNGAPVSTSTGDIYEAEASFTTEETIGVKRHFWKWVLDTS